MEKYIQKIKLIGKKLFKGGLSYKKSGINPARDWNVLLIVTFIVFVAVSIISFDLYTKVEKGTLFSIIQKSEDSTVKINQKLLSKVVEKIDAKQAIFNEIQRNGRTVFDPSI